MRRLLLAVALIASVFSPPVTVLGAPRRAIAFEETGVTTADGAGSTVATTLTVTSGNLLVCAYAGTNNAPTIASSPSNTWVDVVTRASTPYGKVWSAKSAADGSTTITVTVGATFEYRAIACQEISGHDNTSDYDKAPTYGSDYGATATSGSTGTLTQADEIAVCFVHHNGTAVIAPSGSFTERAESNANRTFETQSQVVSATTALTCGGTWSGDQTWNAAIVTFKAGGGAPASFIPGILNAPVRGGKIR
jgi:hypothetical protein